MPKTKGDGELDPHVHEDEQTQFLFHLFESCCEYNKCYETQCPFEKICVDSFDALLSWRQRTWKKKIRIWQLRKKGVTVADICREVDLKERQVEKVFKELDRLSAKYSE